MHMILFGSWFGGLYCLLLALTGLFLILLILVQRGRGGGLSGAFGGAGGQSAFGTKAGDTFTRITIGAASFWIVLCILGAKFAGLEKSGLMSADPGQQMAAPFDPASASGLATDNDLMVPDAADTGAAAATASDGAGPAAGADAEPPQAEITSDPIE